MTRRSARRYNDFAEAALQLGHADPAVRLAGVYGMINLADRDANLCKQVVETLCGYLRLNRPEDQTVQETIMHNLSMHLRDPEAHTHPGAWSHHSFDFHGVVFTCNINLFKAHFAGTVIFNDTQFTGECSLLCA